MKMKTLATAIALSLPLAFGGAYAQTTTTAESGQNRSAAGGAVSANPQPAPGQAESGTMTGTPRVGTSEENSSTTSNTDNAHTSGTQPDGAAGALQRATPDAAAPGMETQPGSAATTEAITGWSTKDDIMGKSVFNENDEKIGDVNDVVISSDGQTLYLLVGAGGFLGLGSKNVAVPFDRFQRQDDRILLSGYSKEQLKALPEVRTQR